MSSQKKPQRRFTIWTLLNKKDDKGGRGSKLPILRRHSLWTTYYLTYCQMYEDKALKDIEKLTLIPNPNEATVRGYC